MRRPRRAGVPEWEGSVINGIIPCDYNRMTQIRRTISISRELDVNLEIIARRRQESLSALIEVLLREHRLVDREIQQGRLEDSIDDFGIVPRKGSPERELMEARTKESAASGGESPKPRRKGAARP